MYQVEARQKCGVIDRCGFEDECPDRTSIEAIIVVSWSCSVIPQWMAKGNRSNKQDPMQRPRMIQWAYSAPIEGRTNSVSAARKCLLYLVSTCNVEQGASNYLRTWETPKRIMKETGLLERTTQRALRRLIDAGLIKRIYSGPYSCFGIQYPGTEAKR